MHLGPHQFQVQARCFEDSLHFASSALLPFAHGFTGLQIDAEALLNGTVSVVHARGILPDGTPFQIPECDAPPPARPVAELFPPVADALTVWLCLPVRRIPQDAAAPDALPARHRAEAALVPDENTGRDERSVTLAKKRFELLLDMESRDGFTALPLARVRRDGAGHFLYDAEFVPPSLDVSASEPLMRLTRRAIELLEAKSQTLSQGAAGASAPGVSSHAPARFWLLHAVNSALPPLRHLLLARRGHPELLFLELSRLAGALCTFTLNSDVAKLPAWDHDNPGPVFLALYEHIRLHLETVRRPGTSTPERSPIPAASGAATGFSESAPQPDRRT
jgi:type VI secretion system protein ImpJ